MNKLNNVEMASIAGAMSSIGASLTLERAGIIAGIASALVTCAINAMYMIRKDQREQRLTDAQLEGKP